MGEPMEGEYRDAGRLARAVRIWTLLWMASQVLFGLASAYEVSVISTLPPDTGFTFTSSPPEMAGSDMATGATGLATVILFWVSGILILRWIHRSNANAQTFVEGMDISPGWNVGWFFVPFANLMKPFQGVREAWQASQGSPSWRDVPVPGFMRWWWAFWLLTNLLDNASFRLSLRVETVAQESSVAILSVLSSMFSIPLGFLLIRLVRELTEAQRVQHNSLVFH
jgi:hypothetical protein